MPWRTRSFRSLEMLLAPPPWTTTTMGFMATGPRGQEDQSVLSGGSKRTAPGLRLPLETRSGFHCWTGAVFTLGRIPETQGVLRAKEAAGCELCTKSPGCPSLPGPGHPPASPQQCSAPPPRPLTAGLSFPGELRLKARAGKRRRWRPFHPPRGRSSSLPPGPHVEPRFPGGLSALPPAPRGQGEAGGLELARALPPSAPGPGRVPSRVWGGGFPQGQSTYRGRLRRRTPGLQARPSRPGGCGSCTSGSRRKAALETAQPATAWLATAPRLRTRAGQRAPRSYRKASTHGGGASTSAGVASTSAGVASALSTPAARLLGLGLCWPSTHSSFLIGIRGNCSSSV